MKLKVLTTSDRIDHPGWEKLKASLEFFAYDFEHIQRPFSFGHQLPIIADWCRNHAADCSHILYTDCFDTKSFAPPSEVIQKWNELPRRIKMLISGEKNCYPHPHRAGDYPESLHPWKFVNGGGWLVEVAYFIHIADRMNLNQDSHDQVWLMDAFLQNQSEIMIDNNCEIFQTIAFSLESEWEKVGGRFINKGTGTLPIFFHGNGHTEMNWVYNA